MFKDAINDPVIAADSYVLVNARLALFNAARSWEVALWGKNLSDEQYVAAGPEHRPGRRQSQLQRAANLRRVVYLSLVAAFQFFSWNVTGTRFHIAVAMPSCMPGFMRQRRASRTAESSSFTKPLD